MVMEAGMVVVKEAAVVVVILEMMMVLLAVKVYSHSGLIAASYRLKLVCVHTFLSHTFCCLASNNEFCNVF